MGHTLYFLARFAYAHGRRHQPILETPQLMQRRNSTSYGLILGSILILALACGSDPELLAIENLTDGALNVKITEIPDDQPLEAGESRVATVPFDSMYETELVEITDDTSAGIVITNPSGQVLCEHVATESEPAPRLLVQSDGCGIESRSP